MTGPEIIIALTIHILIPISGLIYFLYIREKMKSQNIQNPPVRELFMIFVTYGGLILVCLTALFWKWSGMASLGTFYLIFGAPVVMAFITLRERKNITKSKYHAVIYRLCLWYFGIAPATFFILYLTSKN
jgi:hypothetical protein